MDFISRHLRTLRLAIVITVIAVTAMPWAAANESTRPVSVRIRWGGGTPQTWSGRIDIAATDNGPPPRFDWQMLSGQRDAAATTLALGSGIVVRQSEPTASDGVDLTIHEWHRARLVVAFGPVSTGTPSGSIDLPISDIFETVSQQPLDGEGNRLSVERTDGDALRVEFDEGGDTAVPIAFGSVRKPGERLRLRIAPLFLMKPGGGDVEIHARLSPGRQSAVIDSRVIPVAAGAQRPDTTTRSGQIPTAFAPAFCELVLPNEEGAFDIVIEAVERRGMRWNRQLASRRIQVVTIADLPPPAGTDEPWKIVYDLDPASPRLHERLRRFPARGLQAMPRPSIALPAMPLPSFTRPSLSMPRMPDVPMPSVSLPAVPLPDVASLVPRLGGLLASGHSTVTPHPLGPMLRFPQATSPRAPAWEGIVIASARPGIPHTVEIDYPTDQRATIAACVLESDAAGATVEVRHAGGFELASTAYDGPARLSTHRFVFWPTTRQPLLVIGNPSTSGPALVGRVRVLAGPTRLPGTTPAPTAPLSAGQSRQTLALLQPLDLTQQYGGPTHVDPDTGRPTSDWISHLIAIRHSADSIRGQGRAGGVVTAYAGGVAAWPSQLTRSPSRWFVAGAIDTNGHDLLGATARVYAREGLALVPGLCFDGAIPSLETLRTGADGIGIACVGADGRPRSIAGGIHYNILDPRVQQAVESIVREAIDRLDATPSFPGIALLLPDDGWLHLPGVAWGLDDATFARFLAAIGEQEQPPDADRFAARGRLVSGPLRNEWLAWRSAEITSFYARLAARVSARGPRTLYVMPTTLAACGDLASRFKPSVAAGAAHDDLVRELGLVAALAGPPGSTPLVFVPPHVATPGARLTERSTVSAANAALTMAASRAGSEGRATALVLRPLDVNLAEVLPHGPFPGATMATPCRAMLEPAGGAGDAMLAKALAVSDARVVFDTRSKVADGPSGLATDQGFAALPALPLEALANVPAPLVIRSGKANGRTWIQVINTSPAPVDTALRFAGSPGAVVDAVSGVAMPVTGDSMTASLTPWDVRAFVADGIGTVAGATTSYAPAIRDKVATAIEKARQRMGVIASPEPLDVLDNPGFELGLADGAGAGATPAVTGWEILEARRGSIDLVPGLAKPGASSGRSLRFSSRNGLSTVRSNPFGPPQTGRISVAAWLRLEPGELQPPLRIAIEGLEGAREYYRFAAIGGLAGGRPLTPEWALFVLQIDDMPTESVDSLRVRFDLLGPGSVQIDEVQVYDLAFDEVQRDEIAKGLARLDHRFKAGDVGGAIVDLQAHWPAFLDAFVSDAAVAARHAAAAEPHSAVAPSPPDQPRQGMLDRVRGWW